ncbi:(2Fe-2S)-binding protein [Spirosoma rhododendri]|uniref:(2Fe-2S)-binding protein n=1 Tax=Spirosoma rhododendri TaxID=2728024 RepID=A0A7L5DT25_9BACT|nr:(2Fe-2S)-binding protein [Spirosoma rhododendri]QJD80601.1 (2Fe-2S)-binding protein [Spirosoma rhododendri]
MTDNDNYVVDGAGRRWFLKQSTALAGTLLLPPLATSSSAHPAAAPTADTTTRPITLRINRKTYKLTAEPRETLLDLMRERLNLTGSKKGCDHGQCGACTVHIDGRRAYSCLTLAVMQQGRDITTIEGLGTESALHLLQAAFIEHDGFQCGFCTPGQLMAGAALLKEGHTGSADEIREWMSGNICRCGAYPGIVSAIQSVKKGGTPG